MSTTRDSGSDSDYYYTDEDRKEGGVQLPVPGDDLAEIIAGLCLNRSHGQDETEQSQHVVNAKSSPLQPATYRPRDTSFEDSYWQKCRSYFTDEKPFEKAEDIMAKTDTALKHLSSDMDDAADEVRPEVTIPQAWIPVNVMRERASGLRRRHFDLLYYEAKDLIETCAETWDDLLDELFKLENYAATLSLPQQPVANLKQLQDEIDLRLHQYAVLAHEVIELDFRRWSFGFHFPGYFEHLKQFQDDLKFWGAVGRMERAWIRGGGRIKDTSEIVDRVQEYLRGRIVVPSWYFDQPVTRMTFVDRDVSRWELTERYG